MRLALLRLSALGDILRVLPAWSNLRRAFPEARLQAVVEDRHAVLLEPFPWLETVTLDRGALSNPFRAWGEWRRVASRLQGAEASLDFHGILKAALIPRLAGIPERWGDGVTKEGSEWLQTHPLPFRYQTRYDQALGLAEAFGRSRGIPGLGRFHPALASLPLPDPGPLWGRQAGPRVVLVPGASRRGAVKRWPLRHWMALSRMLGSSCDLRWSLGPEEAGLREWLPAESGVEALPSMGWWELAGAIRQAHVVVAPDTGLLHLAVALGVPVVALLGPSDPVVAGIPPGTGQVLRTGIPCSPCRERRCQRRQCLEDLHPAQVALAVSGT
ncbi:MAG: glycosyltransferase family 9 protein [Acidobacteria bacterium]|nr:glycosyltransferase family 9 protein [Acidobacteriota bacterium]